MIFTNILFIFLQFRSGDGLNGLDLGEGFDELDGISVNSDDANNEEDAKDGDYDDNGDGDGLASVINEPTAKKKRRPLSLADGPKKKAKLHPAVELLSTLSTAIEKAASQKAHAKALELATSNSRTEAEAKWKSR
jgi:hypothetical protein